MRCSPRNLSSARASPPYSPLETSRYRGYPQKVKGLVLIVTVCCSARVSAGPTGSSHGVPSTGYPGAYLGTVGLSLQADALYGSRLLDSFEMHLRSVAAMTSPRAVADYLEIAVIGAGVSSAKELRANLGLQRMEPQRAAALMLAHALARPEQFHEILDGLEVQKAGLGKQTAKLLREASGRGDRRLIAALRERGAVDPKVSAVTYDRFGQLDRMFDGSGSDGRDTVDIRGSVSVPSGYDGYGPEGRARRNGLIAPARE